MSKSILPYPSLNENLKNRMGFSSSPYSFFYTDDGEEYELDRQLMDCGEFPVFGLDDGEGKWTPDSYGFSCEASVMIESPSVLFGKSGVACRDSKLGLAVQWMSKSSGQRGVFRLCEFGASDGVIEAVERFDFPRGMLRGKFRLRTILYLAESGMPDDSEEHLMNVPGHVFGEMELTDIILDGNASCFPVFDCEEPGKPLWTLIYDCDDPMEDLFSDCVQLHLNRSHASFKYIDRKSKELNEQLLAEVMASAMTQIVEEVRRDECTWGKIISGEDLGAGSVAEAVWYFIDVVLNRKFDSSISISEAARQYFEKEFA